MAGETILVVEDTGLPRRIYTDKLEQEGYRVLQAADGLECLRMLQEEDVDLVLLDLVMPRMSGLEALEAIRRDPRTAGVPVVILSNLGQDDDVERGLALGAAGYLVKSHAKPADISAKIRHTLDHPQPTELTPVAFRLAIAEHAADADAFLRHAKVAGRLWCPACEAGLVLELTEKADRPGWYDAHLICPECGREF